MDNPNLDNIVLALLFSADEPLSVRKIAGILNDESASDIKTSIQNWQTRIDGEAWSVMIEKVAGGYQLSTQPEYAPYIAKLYSGKRKLRLSKAALETLAITAYKQPTTRAEIENVRGVNCGGVIANLMERELIKISGKAKVLGAPFLYSTTHEFLEYLGLDSLKDLPSIEELEALLEREESAIREQDDDQLLPERKDGADEAEIPSSSPTDDPQTDDRVETDSQKDLPSIDEPVGETAGAMEKEPPATETNS
jgi:segregation and condensation protein B